MTQELQSHFMNLYAIALADAQIDTVELEQLYAIGRSKGIEPAEIDALLLHPDKVTFVHPATLEEKVAYLYDFTQIIIADGIVDNSERKMLELFCSRFGFEEANIAGICDFLLAAATDNISLTDILHIIKNLSNDGL